MFDGLIGGHYTRDQVQQMLEIPEKHRGGNWDTGYSEWDNQFFVFCNVDVPGRTGHDYSNHWDGSLLVWEAKNGTTILHPQIQRLLTDGVPVHIFHREEDRLPFTYAGVAHAVTYEATSPVKVTWRFATSERGRPSVEKISVDPNLLDREVANFEKSVLKFSGHRFQSILNGASRKVGELQVTSPR